MKIVVEDIKNEASLNYGDIVVISNGRKSIPSAYLVFHDADKSSLINLDGSGGCFAKVSSIQMNHIQRLDALKSKMYDIAKMYGEVTIEIYSQKNFALKIVENREEV